MQQMLEKTVPQCLIGGDGRTGSTDGRTRTDQNGSNCEMPCSIGIYWTGTTHARHHVLVLCKCCAFGMWSTANGRTDDVIRIVSPRASCQLRYHKRYHAATDIEEKINTVLGDMVHFLNKQRTTWDGSRLTSYPFFSGMVPCAINPARSLANQPAL